MNLNRPIYKNVFREDITKWTRDWTFTLTPSNTKKARKTFPLMSRHILSQIKVWKQFFSVVGRCTNKRYSMVQSNLNLDNYRTPYMSHTLTIMHLSPGPFSDVTFCLPSITQNVWQVNWHENFMSWTRQSKRSCRMYAPAEWKTLKFYNGAIIFKMYPDSLFYNVYDK